MALQRETGDKPVTQVVSEKILVKILVQMRKMKIETKLRNTPDRMCGSICSATAWDPREFAPPPRGGVRVPPACGWDWRAYSGALAWLRPQVCRVAGLAFGTSGRQ